MDFELKYLQLLREVRYGGRYRSSRAGRTVGKFGLLFRVDSLRSGLFPLLTTRKMFPIPVLGELAGFIGGKSAVEDFKALGCNYWDMNAKQWAGNKGIEDVNNMHLGRIYGVQWRDWMGSHDQLDALIMGIKSDPYGRRHLVTAWNPSELSQMALPPCHIMLQAYVNTDGYIDLSVAMRSVDLCLGLPSDVVLYAAFLIALAQATGHRPGSIIWQLGDAHIYENHLAELTQQEKREPYPLPTWNYKGIDMLKFHPSQLEIKEYQSHESLRYALN